VCKLVEEVDVEVALGDPTNGVFMCDALAVSVDTDVVVALDSSSLAVLLAPVVVPVAADAAEPVDEAVSVTAAAVRSVFVADEDDADEDDNGALVVPVPVVAAVAAESVTPVNAAVSVAEAEFLMFSASVCVLSSSFALGVSEPPDSGKRPV
jgi:hypothetical protein